MGFIGYILVGIGFIVLIVVVRVSIEAYVDEWRQEKKERAALIRKIDVLNSNIEKALEILRQTKKTD